MKYPLIFLLLMACGPLLATEVSIGPSDVFAQALRIEQEVNLLKRHLGIAEVKPAPGIKAELKPRHVWQTSYFILTKINIFRRRNGLPVITTNSLEPVEYLDPALVYEQTQRILTEIHILKTRLGIQGRVLPRRPCRESGPSTCSTSSTTSPTNGTCSTARRSTLPTCSPR